MNFNLPSLSKSRFKKKKKGSFDELCQTQSPPPPRNFSSATAKKIGVKNAKSAWSATPATQAPNWVFSLKFGNAKPKNHQTSFSDSAVSGVPPRPNSRADSAMSVLPPRPNSRARAKSPYGYDLLEVSTYGSRASTPVPASQAGQPTVPTPFMFSRKKTKTFWPSNSSMACAPSKYGISTDDFSCEMSISPEKSFSATGVQCNLSTGLHISADCDRATLREFFSDRTIKAAIARESAKEARQFVQESGTGDSNRMQPQQYTEQGTWGIPRPPSRTTADDDAKSRFFLPPPGQVDTVDDSTMPTGDDSILPSPESSGNFFRADTLHKLKHVGKVILNSNRMHASSATKKFLLAACEPDHLPLHFLGKKVQLIRRAKSQVAKRESLDAIKRVSVQILELPHKKSGTGSADAVEVEELSRKLQRQRTSGSTDAVENPKVQEQEPVEEASAQKQEAVEESSAEKPPLRHAATTGAAISQEAVEEAHALKHGPHRSKTLVRESTVLPDFKHNATQPEPEKEHRPPSPYSDPATPDEVNQQYWAKHQVHFCVPSRTVLKNYFKMYDEDNSGTLQAWELKYILDDLGRLPRNDADEKVLNKAKVHLDDGDGELTFSEFLNVMAAYYFGVYERIFKDMRFQYTGKDESDKHHWEEGVPLSHLKPMLHAIYQSGFTVQYEHLDDIILKVEKVIDADDLADGLLHWHDFLELMKHYRRIEFNHIEKTAGFEPMQVQVLMESFYLHDKQGDGTLDIREIVSFMNNFRPINNMNYFVALFARVDGDKSASLDFHEFLRLVRIYGNNVDRDDEGAQSALKSSDKLQRASEILERAQAVIGSSSLVDNIFPGGGNDEKIVKDFYYEAVSHIAEDGIFAREYNLSVYEVRALRESFEYFDCDATGVVDSSALKLMVSFMGCPLTTKLQNELFDEVLQKELSSLEDEVQELKKAKTEELLVLEETQTPHNRLTQHENDRVREGLGGVLQFTFRGLLSLIGHYHMRLPKEIFMQFEEQGVLGKEKVVLAFYQVGQYLHKKRMEELREEAGVEDGVHDLDLASFSRLLACQRDRVLLDWRKTCGFSKVELAHFRTVFLMENTKNRKQHKKKDSLNQSSEYISIEGLKAMLSVLGFDGAFDHDIMMRTISRSENFDAARGMHFDDMLLLLRHLENRKLNKIKKAEKLLIQELGLEEASVNLFRTKFVSYCHNDHSITIQQVKLMLVSDCKVVRTQDQRRVLNGVIKEIVGDADVLSFMDFLRILQRLDNSDAF